MTARRLVLAAGELSAAFPGVGNHWRLNMNIHMRAVAIGGGVVMNNLILEVFEGEEDLWWQGRVWGPVRPIRFVVV